MHDTHRKSMSPFEFFLRTGRKVPNLSTISLKFNPWHDPDDGRFTFREQGTAYGGGRSGGGASSGRAPSPKRKPTHFGGFGGGGGGFNGGGASGPLPEPTRTPSDKPRSSAKPKQSEPAGLRVPQARDPVPKPRAAVNPIRHVVERNGYRFGLDEKRRTLAVQGRLRIPETTDRSRTSQRQAGGSDRRSDDDGGHYIAARFGGPKDTFNHFAQNASFNREKYRVIEDGWAKALRANQKVRVDISVSYKGGSERPAFLEVRWTINGLLKWQYFANEKDRSK